MRGMEFRHTGKLAAHVVGGFHLAGEGWAAKNKFPFAKINRIGQIGVAAGELTDYKRSRFRWKMAAQKRFELGEIKFFARAHGTCLVTEVRHECLSNRASRAAATPLRLFPS